MFRRRNPRIQQQQLSYVDVLDVIGAIMNDTESSYDNMTADQLTSSALGTLMLRRIDLTDIYFRAPEADESYRQEIQEAVDFVDENTNIIRRFRNIIRQRGRGLTVRDLREIYGEQERQREEAAAAKKAEEEAAAAKKAEEERRRIALEQGFYLENPDGDVVFAVPSTTPGSSTMYPEGEGGI